MKNRNILLAALFALPLLFIMFFVVPKASAATITVDTTATEFSDPGPGTGCSLMEAIEAANTDATYGGCGAGSGPDTITVPAGTYTTNGSMPYITDELELLGDEAGGTIIEGFGVSFGINGDNLNYSLRNLTIQNVVSNGIYVGAGGSDNYTVNIDNVTTIGVEVGIYHYRDLNSSSGTVNITDSVFDGSTTAGLYNNECVGVGTMYVTNSVIRDADAPAIINECGHVVLNSVTIANNHNYDDNGGGILSRGELDMTNVTLFNNTTDTSGGAISLEGGGGTPSGEDYGTSVFTNVTIAGNHAPDTGGLYVSGFYASPELHNVLLTGNDGEQCVAGLELDPTSSNNMSTDASCSDFDENGFTQITDAKLATALADNGGSATIGSGGLSGNVPTLALLEGSPAINAGDDEFCPATDERDADRPFGDTCDVGAYEALFTPAGTPATTENQPTLADTGQSAAVIAITAVIVIAAGSISLFKFAYKS